MKYTVVGLWEDNSRVAAWVEADSPEEAVAKAEGGEGHADGENGFLLVAGVFEGHLTAVDEQ